MMNDYDVAVLKVEMVVVVVAVAVEYNNYCPKDEFWRLKSQKNIFFRYQCNLIKMI
jgi:hypothetical protein